MWGMIIHCVLHRQQGQWLILILAPPNLLYKADGKLRCANTLIRLPSNPGGSLEFRLVEEDFPLSLGRNTGNSCHSNILIP